LTSAERRVAGVTRNITLGLRAGSNREIGKNYHKFA